MYSMTNRKQFSLLAWQVYVGFLLLGFFLLPAVSHAASQDQDVAAWVPWWSEVTGANSATEHIDELDIIYPFVYEVQPDGTLKNRVNFKDKHWKNLLSKAKGERVKVIPSLAWFDGDAIHKVLSDKKTRKKHVDDIVKMVKKNKFDGVNIDYEEKLGETKDYFSLFLKELNTALGRKVVTCTVEARTPPESRWKEVPSVIEYSNDYKAMNEYCDWVEIMTYDQQRADLKLNEKRRGVPYMPVADNEWVEKVIDLALEEFDNDKVMLGVATYGRAWDVTVANDWYKDYTKVATLNQPRILELSEKYKSPIGRSEGGEAVISYFPEDSVWNVLNQLPAPKGTPKGYEATAKALLAATQSKSEIPVRFITWSDAKSIEDKTDLVKKYNLKGTAIFKVDGEEDPGIWELF